MRKKNCIFHVPNYINIEGKTGSQLRPIKMLKAFEAQGYSVDVVMGYGRERKRQISQIKEKIKNGKKYDFVYSESSTMPTILTEKHHLPLYPFLDFGFLQFCKKNGMKIGLFYRDIYWKFPIYKESVHGIKYWVAQICYQYDLMQYEKLLSAFYLPTKKMSKYVNKDKLSVILEELPPGAEVDFEEKEKKHKYYLKRGTEKERISIFYVGGIMTIYSFSKLFEVVNELDYLELTLCCREEEWIQQKENYKKYLGKRIQVIHKFGSELKEYYDKADICMAWFDRSEYMDFAMPVKIFEYLGKTIPVIATEGTAAGNFVEENNTGWVIPYSKDRLKELFQRLYSNQNLIIEKHENCRNAVENNTWISRAEKVIYDLCN